MKTRAAGVFSSIATYLLLAQNAFAQSSTGSAGVGGGGATSSSLPNAGTVEMTYFIFAGGVALFVFGMIKIISSYRD